MPKKTAQPAHEKVTAAHIRAGLKKYFPHPEHGIVFEVAQATGWNAHRHLDAIAMDTWPSRGMLISGIEIKVDLYDWRREKASPEKAEQIARFCDKFWVAAPPGLIPVDELPSAWGLLEGGQYGMRVKKQASKTKAVNVTREFMAAVMRASGRPQSADDSAIALAGLGDKLEGEYADKVAAAASRRSENNSQDADNWRTLMQALGITEDKYFHGYVTKWEAQGWIAAIKAVHASGATETYHGLLGLRENTAKFLEGLEAARDLLHVEVPPAQAGLLAHIGKKKKGKI